MLIVGMLVAGAVAVVAAWTLVATDRASIWPAMSGTNAALGLAALLTGRVSLSPRLRWPIAGAAGIGAGVVLYLATALFVLTARRWPRFERHVREIYGQRKGLGLLPALLLAAGVNAAGGELFWGGLVPGRAAP